MKCRIIAAACLFLSVGIADAQAQQAINAETISLRELAATVAERDRQYAQQFLAAKEALAVALVSQDKATAAAFAAAKEAVAAALAAQEKATAAAFAAANEAVKTAQVANEKRLDSVNEFRAQLKDQAATFVARSEVSVQFKSLTDKVEEIDARSIAERARYEGASNLWTVMAAAAGLLIGLAMAGLAIFRRLRRDEMNPDVPGIGRNA